MGSRQPGALAQRVVVKSLSQVVFVNRSLGAQMRRGGIEIGRGFLGERLAFEAAPPFMQLHLLGDENDGQKVRALLQKAEETQRSLDDDECLLFLLGYEAQVALQDGWPRHSSKRSNGPDAALWRLKKKKVDEKKEEEKRGETGLLRQGDGGSRNIFTTTAAKNEHQNRIASCLEPLADGTIYQANLAHGLRIPNAGFREGYAFYERFAEAPFSAFVDVEEWGSLISLSPECFFRMNIAEGWARAYPIKGTVPRGEDGREDALRKKELEESQKDAAEHLMIVDLMRNDLGKAARKAGVHVEELMRVVAVKNVFHLESVVRAELREGVGLAEVLCALSPGGSITGAPKSSAVEVIHELEAGARGPYTGTFGVLNAKGETAFSILIRTWIRPDDGAGTLHVGGGVVVKSTPAGEWAETLHKAAAFGNVSEGDA